MIPAQILNCKPLPGAGVGASKALRGGDIQQEEDAGAGGQSAVQADQHPGVPGGGRVSDRGSEGHQDHCSGGAALRLCVSSLFNVIHVYLKMFGDKC